MAVSASLLGTSSVRHKNIHSLGFGHGILEIQQGELMPKKDKDECIKVFLTELKNQKLAGHDGITCHPSMLEEDSKLKFSLGYIISSGPAWAT